MKYLFSNLIFNFFNDNSSKNTFKPQTSNDFSLSPYQATTPPKLYFSITPNQSFSRPFNPSHLVVFKENSNEYGLETLRG